MIDQEVIFKALKKSDQQKNMPLNNLPASEFNCLLTALPIIDESNDLATKITNLFFIFLNLILRYK